MTTLPQWIRVLTDEEANCYWANYPDAVKTNISNGLPLNAKTASFEWNWAANNDKIYKNVHCKVNGKYDRHLSETEAKCYWINHPTKAGNFTKNGHVLSVDTANFAWNFVANSGANVESVICDKMLSKPEAPPPPPPAPKTVVKTNELSDSELADAFAALKKKLMSEKSSTTTSTTTSTPPPLDAPTCPVAGDNVFMPANCVIKV